MPLGNLNRPEPDHFRLLSLEVRTRSENEYLRLIFDLSKASEGPPLRVSTSAIAEALGIKAASVTAMVQRLSEAKPPLLEYQKHQGVILTEAGNKSALETMRNHRLLELFLYKIMEFPRHEVHQEALRLQHSISPAFTQKMATLLDNPEYDPHGAPIPDEEFNLPQRESVPFSQAPSGTTVEVLQIPDENTPLLLRLEASGLVPGRICEVINHSELEGALRWRTPGIPGENVLSQETAKLIRVRIIP